MSSIDTFLILVLLIATLLSVPVIGFKAIVFLLGPFRGKRANLYHLALAAVLVAPIASFSLFTLATYGLALAIDVEPSIESLLAVADIIAGVHVLVGFSFIGAALSIGPVLILIDLVWRALRSVRYSRLRSVYSGVSHIILYLLFFGSFSIIFRLTSAGLFMPDDWQSTDATSSTAFAPLRALIADSQSPFRISLAIANARVYLDSFGLQELLSNGALPIWANTCATVLAALVTLLVALLTRRRSHTTRKASSPESR